MAAPHSDTDDMIVELIKDHREVEELFTAIEGAVPGEHREQLVREMITELVRHAVAEEQYLYPESRRVLPDGEALVKQELEEHAEAEQLLKRIEQADPADPDREASLALVMSTIRQHVAEEEGELFPRLRAASTQERLDELGDKVRMAKKTAPTHPHPSAPDTPPVNMLMDPMAGLVDRVRDKFSKDQ